VTPQNDPGELYLTDVVSILVAIGAPVEALAAPHPEECMGINDRKQLADVAAVLRRRTLERLMAEGVTILDPAATYVRHGQAGADTASTRAKAGRDRDRRRVRWGRAAVSGAHRRPRHLRPFCVLSDAVVGPGPSARSATCGRSRTSAPAPRSATSWS
jgi:hypothetical protein